LDFDSMAEELVHLGLSAADKAACDMHSRVVDRVEREVIAQVLAECEGIQIKAAARLGINRNTLHKKLKQYGLDDEEEAAS
jgi:two-component system response regulator AtoC